MRVPHIAAGSAAEIPQKEKKTKRKRMCASFAENHLRSIRARLIYTAGIIDRLFFRFKFPHNTRHDCPQTLSPPDIVFKADHMIYF